MQTLPIIIIFSIGIALIILKKSTRVKRRSKVSTETIKKYEERIKEIKKVNENENKSKFSNNRQNNNYSQEQNDKEQYAYIAKTHIMSNAELSFYHCMKSMLSSEHAIFTKVRMEDIINADKEAENSYGLRGRIKSRHIDFVICDAQTGKIQRAIELNDQSHNRRDQQERDKFVKQAFETAGIKLLTMKCQKSYSREDIEKLFS